MRRWTQGTVAGLPAVEAPQLRATLANPDDKHGNFGRNSGRTWPGCQAAGVGSERGYRGGGHRRRAKRRGSSVRIGCRPGRAARRDPCPGRRGAGAPAAAQNEKLTYTLREAREHIAALREEVDKLTQPPAAYGTLLSRNDDGTVDVYSGGRKMRVAVHPALDADDLVRGGEVVLNESLNVVMARTPETTGEVVTVKELLEEADRAIILGRADEERVADLSEGLKGETLRAGDSVLMDPRSGLLLEKLPRPEVEELVLEEVPDISYADIGGLDDQIEQIADAVELPFLHQELFAEHKLPAPKGILLYGPPGCGKTLIAKAVANSLAKKVDQAADAKAKSYFLNIKGPELLNKYVGETERQIRLVFQRAREKSEEGWPVIVF